LQHQVTSASKCCQANEEDNDSEIEREDTRLMELEELLMKHDPKLQSRELVGPSDLYSRHV
jgi:hypothetical protein